MPLLDGTGCGGKVIEGSTWSKSTGMGCLEALTSDLTSIKRFGVDMDGALAVLLCVADRVPAAPDSREFTSEPMLKLDSASALRFLPRPGSVFGNCLSVSSLTVLGVCCGLKDVWLTLIEWPLDFQNRGASYVVLATAKFPVLDSSTPAAVGEASSMAQRVVKPQG